MLTSEFGARRADSIATAYGCAGTSSGRTRMGVWQARTKSRVTVMTKSGLDRYIFFRKASTMSIVISGLWAHSPGPQPLILLLEQVRHLRTGPTGLRQHGGDDPPRRPLQQVPDEGADDAEAHHQELLAAQMIHQAKLVIGVGVPRPVDLQRA